MTDLSRRTAIVGGLALATDGAFAAAGTDETTAAEDDGVASGTDGERETTARFEAEDGPGPATAGAALELSVSAPESVSATDRRAEFLLTVRNCGDETVSVPIVLEIARLVDELETMELAPGEDADAYATYAGERLEAGDCEWTVAAGERREHGTLSVRE